MERIRVVYSGRVQGVGFRATAVAAAKGRRVTGWVRNDADGGVTLEVQGAGEDVAAYLGDVRVKMGGLIAAQMAGRVEVEPGEEGFEVRR